MAGGDVGERQLLLITTGIFAFLVLGFGGVIWWGKAKHANLKGQVKKLSIQADAKRRELSELTVEKKKHITLKQRNDKYSRFLARSSEIGDVLKRISGTSITAGLELRGYDRLATTAPAPLAEEACPLKPLLYEWKFLGSMNQIFEFIYNIERPVELGRLVEIREFEIKARAGGLLPKVEGGAGHEFRVTLAFHQRVELE